MLQPRYAVFFGLLVLTAVFFLLMLAVNIHFLWPLAFVAVLSVVGIHDLVQTRHSILRNYPVIGHFRFMFEAIRPEMRQYFFESNQDGRPFSRERRSLVYDRAKDIEGNVPSAPNTTSMTTTIPG